MKINIYFIPADKDFSKSDKDVIKKIIIENAIIIAKKLPFKAKTFTFTVYPWKRKGTHGFTQADDWVRLAINPKDLNLKKAAKEKILNRVSYLVYHEMHHASRGYTGYLPDGKDHILINSVLSEGLADVFAEESIPDAYDPKSLTYNVQQIKTWLGKIDKIKWQKEISRNPWIFGGEGKPPLLGYKMGRHLVSELKKKHPELNAVKLVKVDAKKILKLSNINFNKITK